MNMLFISGSMPPLDCGIGFYSAQLLKHVDAGTKITLLTTTGLAEETATYDSQYVPSWRIRDIRQILKIVKGSKPDVISLQYPAKGYKRQLGINLLPYFLKKYPVVVTLHEFHGSGFLGRLRNLITALPVNKIVVSNTADKMALPRFLRNKTTIIPIGSNIQKTSPNIRLFNSIITQAKFDPKKPIGVFFGYAFPSKGIEILLEAANISKSQILLLCGLDANNAYQSTLLEKISATQKTGASIYCAGHMNDADVSAVLQECTYFVLSQPLPINPKSGTTIAAVTHGLPIISTGASDPGLNLPYIHNVNSLLLQDMTADNLAKTFMQVDENPVSLRSLHGGVVKLSDYFSWDKIWATHLVLYEELVHD